MSAQTSDGKKTYQRYAMRIVRYSDEAKRQLREVLHDCLNLHFICEKYMWDIQRSSSVKSHVPICPNYSLKSSGAPGGHRKIKLFPKGEQHGVVETYSVVVPVDHKLHVLLPLYRDVALKFASEYRASGIGVKDVREVMRAYQSLKLTELVSEKEALNSQVDELVFVRILQEKHRAIQVLREALNLQGSDSLEKLSVFDQKPYSLWVLGMRKLHEAGFGFFESKLAVNQALFWDAEDVLLESISEEDKPRHIATHELYSGPSFLDTEENSDIVEWQESESNIDNARKYLVYQRLRENELRKEQVDKAIIAQTRARLIKFIKDGGSRIQLYASESKSRPEVQKRTLETYDTLISEGFTETLTLKLKRGKEVTVESVTDAETKAKEFDEAVTALIIAGLTEEEIWKRLRQQFYWLGGENADLWRGRIRNIRKDYDASQVTPNSHADKDKSETEKDGSE